MARSGYAFVGLLAAALLAAPAAQAQHDHRKMSGMAASPEEAGPAMQAVAAGDLAVSGGWARAMLPGQPAGGAYLTIANAGAAPDRLVAAASPRAARVEIHSMAMSGDVMTMREVEGGLEIPAGGSVTLAPGGLHLMFMKVGEPFRAGETVPVELRFERAGTVEVTLPVRPAGG